VAATRTRQEPTSVGPSEPDSRRGRTVRSASSKLRLPTGRALVGGALVVTAATGVLVAHRTASQPPSTRFVVVTRAVDAGSAVTAADLGTATAELPSGVSAVPAAQAQDVVGRVARIPLGAMDLLRPGDLFEPDRFTPPAVTEVALDLPPAQALFGTLRIGDRVDVLSTDPDGSGTTTVASGVVVTEVGSDDDTGIGAAGTVQVRVGLPDSVTAEAVIDAAVRSEVTLALPSPDGRGDGGAG
jgi:hypothetical protein